MRIRSLFFLGLILSALAPALAEDYQPRNTQKPGEEPNTPEEAAAAITLPEGFQARLFAGEPDVRQPVAMALDDRGRLWVAESYSYKEWKRPARTGFWFSRTPTTTAGTTRGKFSGPAEIMSPG